MPVFPYLPLRKNTYTEPPAVLRPQLRRLRRRAARRIHRGGRGLVLTPAVTPPVARTLRPPPSALCPVSCRLIAEGYRTTPGPIADSLSPIPELPAAFRPEVSTSRP